MALRLMDMDLDLRPMDLGLDLTIPESEDLDSNLKKEDSDLPIWDFTTSLELCELEMKNIGRGENF